MDGVGHTYTDFTSMEIYLQESICGIVALLQSAVKKSYRVILWLTVHFGDESIANYKQYECGGQAPFSKIKPNIL